MLTKGKYIMKWIKYISVIAACGMMAACDWSAGGEDNAYNSRYNWVNFTGVYRPISGKYVVTDYSDGTPAAPGSPASSFQVNTSETVATGTGSKTVFSGVVSHGTIVAGSFTISSSGFTLTDDGAGGLSGGGATGTIDYTTGTWSVDFGGFAPDAGSSITASYSYTTTTLAEPGTNAILPGPGTTQFELFSFAVSQSGEQITLVDNTGRTYKGKLGSIRTTGNASHDTVDDNPAATPGDIVFAIIDVSGVSPAGLNVRIAGNFQAVVGAGNTLTQKQLMGTWIEEGGRTGDINAQSGP